MRCEDTLHKGSAVSWEKVSLRCLDVEETVKGPEMAQWSSTLPGPAEDPDSVPKHLHGGSQWFVTPVPAGSDVLLWLLWALRAYGAYT